MKGTKRKSNINNTCFINDHLLAQNIFWFKYSFEQKEDYKVRSTPVLYLKKLLKCFRVLY